MSASLSRAIVTFAGAMLGQRQSQWAAAMRSELDVAIDRGEALGFALGCLLASARQILRHQEGRFGVTAYMLVLGLLVPMAALQIANVMSGLPSLLGESGFAGLMTAGRAAGSLVTAVYGGAFPFLMALPVLVALAHLRMAWHILDRDWERAAAAGAFALALSVTLILLLGALLIDIRQALMQGLALLLEFIAMAGLVQWHAEFPENGNDLQIPT